MIYIFGIAIAIVIYQGFVRHQAATLNSYPRIRYERTEIYYFDDFFDANEGGWIIMKPNQIEILPDSTKMFNIFPEYRFKSHPSHLDDNGIVENYIPLTATITNDTWFVNKRDMAFGFAANSSCTINLHYLPK